MRIEQRLAKPEEATGQGEPVLVWRETGETAADAEARYRRDHAAELDRPISVVGWLAGSTD